MRGSGKRTGRLAAVIALVAAGAVIVSLVVLLVRDLDALIVALAALAVAGAAGWFALTRRGAARVLGLVCMVAALAAGAVGLVYFDALDELIVLALTLTAFFVATRSALRQSVLAQRPAPPGPALRASRPGKAVLIMNPWSGGGKVDRFDLEGEARRRGIEPVLLRRGDDLRALAVEAASRAEVIGMAGGDGSQALVAQVAMEHELPYVCVPAGTRNHLALDLGLDREDVVGALDAFASDVERRIDLAFVNDRIFVNNVSLGVYAEIVQSDAYRNAKLQTMEEKLPELLGPRATPFDLRFATPGGGEQRSTQLLLVSNNRYILDRLVGGGSRPRLDTGRLGIVSVEIGGAAQAAKLLSLEALGQINRFDGWLEWSATEFEVASGGPVATGIDGESVVLEPPLRFVIAPAALSIRLPPTSAGLSPAAMRPELSGSSLGELWRLAAGRG